MNDDRSCGCDDVGALNYVDALDIDGDELDLVLDEPDDLAAMLASDAVQLGALEVVGDELIDLDGDDLGFLDDLVKFGYKVGKKVVDVVAAPSKSKAKQAQRKAKSAQQKATAAEAELKAAKAREAKDKKMQEVMEQRRRNQAHEREKRALANQIKELQSQQVMVRRQLGKSAVAAREAEQKAAVEKQRQDRNRKLAIGGGVAATSLLALWALNRKARDDEKEARR